jgi:hypothetical protein
MLGRMPSGAWWCVVAAVLCACSEESVGGDDDDDGIGGTGAAITTGGTTSGTGGTGNTGGDGGMGATEQCATGPLPAPLAGCAPAPAASTGDPHQDCVDRINQFRWQCQCLPPLMRWNSAEGCTDQQSGDDQASGSAHGNFGACGEFAQNTCPNWGNEADVIGGCLQAMWDEGPGQPFSEHGHYLNMSSSEFTRVACGFSAGPSGVWSNQNFSQ